MKFIFITLESKYKIKKYIGKNLIKARIQKFSLFQYLRFKDFKIYYFPTLNGGKELIEFIQNNDELKAIKPKSWNRKVSVSS